ncbi:MAG: DUF72 domain-containing protein [Myxococcales bacterium]
MATRARIRVGTSGYVYPHWKGRFYPDGLPARQWLPYYAQAFDTVELNNTFYRLPSEKAARGWAAAAPEGFLFAVKGSRFLTHIKRLKDTEQGLQRFFESLAPLAGRIGPVLWQLPPQMKADLARLRDFLQALPRFGRFEHVVEPRSAGWYTDAFYRLLADEGASLCLHDLPMKDAPAPPTPPPGRIYYRRFHGLAARYSGRYGRAALSPVADQMLSLARSGVPCFAYFNNDASAHAVADARDLLWLLSERAARRATTPGSHPAPAV